MCRPPSIGALRKKGADQVFIVCLLFACAVPEKNAISNPVGKKEIVHGYAWVANSRWRDDETREETKKKKEGRGLVAGVPRRRWKRVGASHCVCVLVWISKGA
jgi:hypothetical protein